MAAGTYQPIVPWDVEAFRSGALPHLEAISLTAKLGAPAVIDANGRIAEAGTTFLQAYGILAKAGSNGAAAGNPIMVYPIRPDVLWEVTFNEAIAQTNVGKAYGLLKDGTTGNWYMTTADSGNQMTVAAIHPATSIGDTKMRVLARFNPRAIQSFPIASSPVGNLSASGAVTPNVEATYAITKAGVAALTLAAPTAGVDDGKIITINSNTANAHTLTATALLNTGSANVNVATFAAFAGAGLVLMAYQAKWNVISQIGITFS